MIQKQITRQQENSATFAVAVESIVDVTVEETGWSEYDFMASLNLYSTEEKHIWGLHIGKNIQLGVYKLIVWIITSKFTLLLWQSHYHLTFQ